MKFNRFSFLVTSNGGEGGRKGAFPTFSHFSRKKIEKKILSRTQLGRGFISIYCQTLDLSSRLNLIAHVCSCVQTEKSPSPMYLRAFKDGKSFAGWMGGVDFYPDEDDGDASKHVPDIPLFPSPLPAFPLRRHRSSPPTHGKRNKSRVVSLSPFSRSSGAPDPHKKAYV